MDTIKQKIKKFALIPIYKQKKKHMKKILNKFVSKNPEFIYKIGNDIFHTICRS